MSGFLSGLGSALRERVLKAYKSTLIGLALAVADVVITQLDLAALPTWAHAIVGVASSVLLFYRGKVQAPALTPAP